MPKASMQSASQSASQPGYEGHYSELDGHTVAFEHFSDGRDFSPLFRELRQTMEIVMANAAALAGQG